MPTTTHTIPVTDDESVVAVHHEASSDRWLVFCHGFLSDKSGSYERRCERAVSKGYNAVRFDFRGCGDSDGAFAEQGLSEKLADCSSVVDHFALDAYALFGSSFGGKVAFHAAARDDRVEAVVTRAPVTFNRSFDEYRSVVDRERECRFDDGRRIDRGFFDDLERYSFPAAATEIDVPVAIFHGACDESVDVADSVEAARLLGRETDVLLETVAEEGHLFSAAAEERLRRRTFHWLESW
ncbi:alpha/beta hydrolase family protein [Natronobeatus ordinarius]|uniref:alpha/beta hydrolase family protein n=1 Tax=Natronobeatus ordinarius TaxID=2963433 RepID=UPI0020CC0DD4|nr:alpha/beta hydrolase [Natronobeatus ordinarius]